MLTVSLFTLFAFLIPLIFGPQVKSQLLETITNLSYFKTYLQDFVYLDNLYRFLVHSLHIMMNYPPVYCIKVAFGREWV